ncbi:hypothetical protein FTX61_02360 [Nitriliruptoraceae bacterium ZYF776]|nr:hypothetical protein [Profundirhabdus halotolerans]
MPRRGSQVAVAPAPPSRSRASAAESVRVTNVARHPPAPAALQKHLSSGLAGPHAGPTDASSSPRRSTSRPDLASRVRRDHDAFEADRGHSTRRSAAGADGWARTTPSQVHVRRLRTGSGPTIRSFCGSAGAGPLGVDRRGVPTIHARDRGDGDLEPRRASAEAW